MTFFTDEFYIRNGKCTMGENKCHHVFTIMIRLCGKDIELEYISQNLSQSNQFLVRPSIYLIIHILKILFHYI